MLSLFCVWIGLFCVWIGLFCVWIGLFCVSIGAYANRKAYTHTLKGVKEHVKGVFEYALNTFIYAKSKDQRDSTGIWGSPKHLLQWVAVCCNMFAICFNAPWLFDLWRIHRALLQMRRALLRIYIYLLGYHDHTCVAEAEVSRVLLWLSIFDGYIGLFCRRVWLFCGNTYIYTSCGMSWSHLRSWSGGLKSGAVTLLHKLLRCA